MSILSTLAVLAVLNSSPYGATDGPGSDRITAAALPDKRVSFLGFSANESVCAWRVQVTEPRAGNTFDRFTLIRIVNADTNEIVATIQGSGISRGHESKRSGWQSIPTSQATLLAANPEYANALPRAEWSRVQQKARFIVRRVANDVPVVRLSADDDMRAALKAQKHSITVKGELSSPLGFHAVAYQFDGQLVSLGYFRIDAVPNHAMNATVETYVSPSGYRVAVLSKFELLLGNGQTRGAPIANVTRLSEILGHTDAGGLNLLNAQLRHEERLIHETAPEWSHIYSDYLGK